VRRSREVPELLAPAGSWDGLVAALDAGADAVYLAGKRFGARKGAQNFDDQQLQKAIDLAHLRGVRVYVAVNTLIPEAEVGEVAELLLALYEMGADAVLVQDLGVLRLARDIVPDLVLHASTQMTISSLEGARWAADMGLSRAVLARELTLPEVVEIGEKASIGVEVFVHGALCYSYSGQCLLSSAIAESPTLSCGPQRGTPGDGRWSWRRSPSQGATSSLRRISPSTQGWKRWRGPPSRR